MSKQRQADYSTRISDISAATTIKHNQLFLLSDNTGDILPQSHGSGLYFRDMRYLDQLELRLHGQPLTSLLADASTGSEADFELTNRELQLANGQTLPKERISLRRTLSLGDGLTHTVEARNLSREPVALELELRYASTFADIFMVRGSPPGKRGTIRPPHARRDQVTLSYDGADQHTRTTTLHFAPRPDELSGERTLYRLSLAPGERATLTLNVGVADNGPRANAHASGKQTSASGARLHGAFGQELRQTPRIETSNPLFDRALARSLADICMLATTTADDIYIAAGIPWYVALFGRDSLITAFETLAYHPSLARSTLRLLAKYQGKRHNHFQDEEPGKILHELRVGEQANLHEIPMIPYYGTVDATPWFLILLAEYIRWTGDLDLFTELRENVDRALHWMDANEANQENLSGYLSYGTRSEQGLQNQGWKDSDNGIVNADGSLCAPPIALVEVQGYAYHARCAMATLFQRVGEHGRAERMKRQAAELRSRFNDDYWLGGDTGYALCLQRERRPSRAVASNPGQTLFTGIATPDHARATADRLMRDDMFCDWGVRTLSAKERAYNPLDYQVGSVWPHDNALIALGLRRSGFPQAMGRIFTGIFEAATHFEELRLPEVFDGFSKQHYSRPVHYPIACRPQAWAAGALPLLLQTALGLEPDALAGALRIRHPHLPNWLPVVTCRGLRVAGATVDLQYRREGETTLAAVLERQGDLEVVIEQ